MKYKLIGFDLDGTLINTLPDLHQAVSLSLRDLNLYDATENQVLTWIGKGGDVLIKNALIHHFAKNNENITADEVAKLDIFQQMKERFSYHYDRHLCDKTHPYKGVVETLKELKSLGFKMVVITNKPSKFVPELLKNLKLDSFFDFYLGGNCLEKIKPNPDPLLLAIDRVGVAKDQMLFVGDSKNDIIAAKAAGVDVVGLSYGYNYNEPISDENPTFVCNDFKEILAIVKQG